MKKYLLVSLSLLILLDLSAQVAITTDGSQPHASAMLDVKSTNRGFLMPRVTLRTNVSAPATGLMVYETNTNAVWVYNGSGWVQLGSGSGSSPWLVNGTHIYNMNTGNVGIGTTTPGTKLHLAGGDMRMDGTNPTLQMQQSGEDKGFLQLTGNSLRLGTNSSNGAGKIIFRAFGNDHVFIDSIGQLGIGKSVPQFDLDVNGNARIQSTSGYKRSTLSIYANPNYIPDAYGPAGVTFFNYSSLGGNNYDYTAKYRVEMDGGALERLKLYHVDNDNQLVLNKLGEVGIGVAPTEKLDVYGGKLRVRDGAPIIKLQSNSNTALTSGIIEFANYNNLNMAKIGTVSGKLKLSGRESVSFINDDLVLDNGNTGINVSTPLTKLHIEGGQDAGLTSGANGYIMLGDQASTNLLIDNNEILVRSGTSTASTLTIQNDGGSINIGGYTSINRDGEGFRLNGNNPSMGFYQNGAFKSFITQTSSELYMGANGNLHLDASGQVAIGELQSGGASYKLAVAGRVVCEEVRVKLRSNWPDYVFAKKYKLLPLNQLEKYIRRNNHLPNIPSAAIIEKEGMDVGDMQKKMMEKIEELTLYVIELQKQIDDLKSAKKNNSKG